jgi:hypothetical protein
VLSHLLPTLQVIPLSLLFFLSRFVAAMSALLSIRDVSSTGVVKPPLSQAVGYIVVVGIGLIIALGKSISIMARDLL